MRVIDVIFAFIAGKVVGFVVSDFLKEFGVVLTPSEAVILWLAFPLLAVFCLWLCFLIGRKILAIYQLGKHLLVGAFATVVDLKVFEILIGFFSLFLFINPLIAKSASFIFSTALKYLGTNYWVFEKSEKENKKKEVAQFVTITLVGLIIDVSIFYYATKWLGPQFGLSTTIWIKTSVILAAIAAAAWNFLGYKFLVFKK